MALVSGMGGLGGGACDAGLAIATFLLLSVALLLLIVRPHRLPMDNALNPAKFCLFGLTCGIRLALTGDLALQSTTIISLLQTLVTLLKMANLVFLRLYVIWSKRDVQAPHSLLVDLAADLLVNHGDNIGAVLPPPSDDGQDDDALPTASSAPGTSAGLRVEVLPDVAFDLDQDARQLRLASAAQHHHRQRDLVPLSDPLRRRREREEGRCAEDDENEAYGMGPAAEAFAELPQDEQWMSLSTAAYSSLAHTEVEFLAKESAAKRRQRNQQQQDPLSDTRSPTSHGAMRFHQDLDRALDELSRASSAAQKQQRKDAHASEKQEREEDDADIL